MAAVSDFSLLSCRSTSDDSIWDEDDKCYSLNNSLLSLLEGILESVPQNRDS